MGFLGPLLEKREQTGFYFFPSAKSSVEPEVCVGRTSRPHRAASGRPRFPQMPRTHSHSTLRPGFFPPTHSLLELFLRPWLARTARVWLAEPNGGGQRNSREGKAAVKVKANTACRQIQGDCTFGFCIPQGWENPRHRHNHNLWLGDRLAFPKQWLSLVLFFQFFLGLFCIAESALGCLGVSRAIVAQKRNCFGLKRAGNIAFEALGRGVLFCWVCGCIILCCYHVFL